MLNPDTVADRFSRAMASRWTDPAADLDPWMESCWTAAAAPEPVDPPAAISLLGDLPAVRWYRQGNTLVGYAHGRNDGCYLIQSAASPRDAA